MKTSKIQNQCRLRLLSRDKFADDESYQAYVRQMQSVERMQEASAKALRKHQLASKQRANEIKRLRKKIKKKLQERDERIQQLNEALSTSQEDLARLRKQVKEFYEALVDKTNVTSRNSNKPPSADSPYHKVNLEKLAEKHGLGDVINEPTEDEIPSDAQTEIPPIGQAQTDVPSGEQDSSSESQPTAQKEEKKLRKAHHKGCTQQHIEPTEPAIECAPTVCPHCGCTEFNGMQVKRIHQFIEVAENIVHVLHFIIQEGTCANCGALVTGKVPKGFEQAFGPNLHTILAWLNTQGGVTRRHLQEFCEDFLGIPISQGGIQKVLKRVAASILPLYTMIQEGAREYWYNHMDETSSPTFGPLGKHIHWMWVMCNESFAFFKIEEHRSKKAFLVVIGKWRGVLISDDYGTYVKWENGRQTCLAHLKRAAKKLTECRDRDIAECGRWIYATITDLCKKKGDKLSQEEIQEIKDGFMTRAMQYKGIGGQAAVLLDRLVAEFEAVIYFLSIPVAPTNNFAEQMLRPYVVVRKNSFGTTSSWGERWLERSLSVRMTCKLREKRYSQVLKEAVSCDFHGNVTDTSWLNSCVYRPR